MTEMILKQSDFEEIIEEIADPSYPSSYCNMLYKFTDDYGKLNDKDFIQALFLYTGFITNDITEDIKKDKNFFINMFELYQTSRLFVDFQNKRSSSFPYQVMWGNIDFLDESLKQDDDVLASILIADPSLLEKNSNIKFSKESISKAMTRSREINPLLWRDINTEICTNLELDDFKDDEEFSLNVIKYDPQKIKKFYNNKDFIIKAIKYNPYIYNYLTSELKRDEEIVENLLRTVPNFDLDSIPNEIREKVILKFKEEIKDSLFKKYNYDNEGFFKKMSIKKDVNNALKNNNWVGYIGVKKLDTLDVYFLNEQDASGYNIPYSSKYESSVKEILSLKSIVLGEKDVSDEEGLSKIKEKLKNIIDKNMDGFVNYFSDSIFVDEYLKDIRFNSIDRLKQPEEAVENNFNLPVNSISYYIAKNGTIGEDFLAANELKKDGIEEKDIENIKTLMKNPIFLTLILFKIEDLEKVEIGDLIDNKELFIEKASNIINNRTAYFIEKFKNNQKEEQRLYQEENELEEQNTVIKHKK